MASKDPPAERGLRAPLSPNEETALLRIASDMMRPRDLNRSAVAHLIGLGLAREEDGILALTALGHKRLVMLPGRVLWRQPIPSSPDVVQLARELGLASPPQPAKPKQR